MANQLASSGIQYSSGSIGGINSLSIAQDRGVVEQNTNALGKDIDTLMGTVFKAAKAYYDLSDDATKIVATDHLVRFKEGAINIENDTNLTPEQKKVKLGELNATLNTEVAEKINNNDRAREIYDSIYSNNARLSYANSMGKLDEEIYKKDVKNMKENIDTMGKAGLSLSTIFDHPNTQTLLSKGEISKKDIVDNYLKGVRASVESDYDQYALNGGDLVGDKFMTKDSNGVRKYDADKLKQYVSTKLNGSVTLQDGVFTVDSKFGTPEEIKSYTNSINSFMANYAEKANRINQIEQNEYEAKVREASREAKAIAREQKQWESLKTIGNANNIEKSAVTLGEVSLEDVNSLVKSQKEAFVNNDQTTYKQVTKSIDTINAKVTIEKEIENGITNSLIGDGNPTNVSLLKGYVNKGFIYKGDMGDVTVDTTAIKNKVTNQLNGRLELEANKIDPNKPETIDSFMQVAQRIRATATSLEVNLSTFNVADDFVKKGLANTVDNPNELLKLAYIAKAQAKETLGDTSYTDKFIGALKSGYDKGNTKGMNGKELSTYMLQNVTGVTSNQKMKTLSAENKIITKNLNNWINTTMPDSSSSILAGILASTGGQEVTDETIDKANSNGTLMDTRSKIQSVVASTLFSHDTNTIVTPTISGKRQDPAIISEGLDSYFVKNKLQKYNYEIGNYIDKNGDVGVMLTNYEDSNDRVFLNNDDILKGYLPKKGNK